MRKLNFLLFIPVLLSSYCFSQSALIDTSFNVIDNCDYGNSLGFTNNWVLSTNIQQDGKVIVGGKFTGFNGVSRNKIARLNTDGSLDLSFVVGAGFNNDVWCTSIQSDGKIIVGGDFTYYGSLQKNKIIRLNNDGSVDLNFNFGNASGFNESVRSIALQPDGKIIVGGNFSAYNGLPTAKLIRLNQDGSIDNSFSTASIPLLTLSSSVIYSIVVQNDGKILVGGYLFGGGQAIVRLNQDGSQDNSFNIGTGINGNGVRSISTQSDSKIIVGGDFTILNGTTRNRLARLNTDGSLDYTFDIGTGFNPNGSAPAIVYCSSVQQDGKIIVGGSFQIFNGTNKFNFLRLLDNGQLDPGFNSNIGFGNTVFSTSLQANGGIIAGGSFQGYNNNVRNYIARINSDGSCDIFNGFKGFNGEIKTVTIQSDDKIIVGGEFSIVNGVSNNRICRLTPNGSVDSTFNFGNSGFNGVVNTTVVQTDGKIVVGGLFTYYNGSLVNRIVRLNDNGTIDLNFNVGSGFNGEVYTIFLQSDGKILVGGNFTVVNGISTYRIVRLNPDGSVDLSFLSAYPFENIIRTIHQQADGKILVGGDFLGKIKRLNVNGSQDLSFNSGGLNEKVRSIIQLPDEKILVGGDFTFNGSLIRNRIARLNANGTDDDTFNSGSGFNNIVKLISLLSNGNYLVIGDFTQYNGIGGRNRIIQLDNNGLVISGFNPGSGFNNSANTLAFQSDDKIVVGGNFNIYNGECKNRLIRIQGGNCNNTFSTLLITTCSAFTLNTQTYTQSGVYTQQLTNSQGCDSTITLNLTITQPTSSTITQTTCSSFNLNNQTYTQSGVYTQQLTNAQGCDSTITLNLTITQPSSNIITQSACSTFNLNDQTYTQSGVYTQQLTNAQGCDSTITLNLTITQPTSSTITQTACSSYTLNNQTYTQSGVYTQQLTNAQGCDSTITLNLTITQPSSSTINQTACSTFTLNNQTYTQSGVYTQQLPNSQGCDSTITLNLTILPLPSVAVTSSSGVLTANQQNATYQWLDCDNNYNPISGATLISFTPLISGNYAVEINQNSCIDTSQCYTVTVNSSGLVEHLISNDRLFPNPNNGSFYFESYKGGNYVITDAVGKIIYSFFTEKSIKKLITITNLPNGVYLIVPEGSNSVPIKLVIE